MSKLEETARNKLGTLMDAVQPIINQHIAEMDAREVDYILTNYRKYLKIDLERDFEKARLSKLTASPFDDILNGGLNG
jgi:hypothetical protein